jgi:hypothetical protein
MSSCDSWRGRRKNLYWLSFESNSKTQAIKNLPSGTYISREKSGRPNNKY